jgi:hypothetical protein
MPAFQVGYESHQLANGAKVAKEDILLGNVAESQPHDSSRRMPSFFRHAIWGR